MEGYVTTEKYSNSSRDTYTLESMRGGGIIRTVK